ncbi:MAG: CoA-transferase [Peptoniphilus sp.]|nr:CoA-transferase [Peptoniphilus sp.]MDD7363474.1 propionate CoA-transferase [Bacillota bacterium]MDY6044822.1 CoA-transferase [Peptoniphilus sp.]
MKLIQLEQAVQCVKDEDVVVVSGFLLQTTPSEILTELGERYKKESSPKNLTVLQAAGIGDNKNEGIYEISHLGMIKRYITGHFANNQRLIQQANSNAIEAYNFPQGVISKMYRNIASGFYGEITKVGLKTFCDPRLEGGKINDAATENLVELLEIGGEEYLYYKAPKIDVAIIRGTTADEQGNITFEEESCTVDAREIAMATKASKGKVIVQVKYMADSKSINRNDVVIPGIFVDYVVLSKSPETKHRQTPANFYSPAIAGQSRVSIDVSDSYPLNERKVIARRAAMELRCGDVVNLGIGIPEIIGTVAHEEGFGEDIILTLEDGMIGGTPLGGADFGSSVNAMASLPMNQQFDFYNGGGLDCAFLGFAEVSAKGDINVSRFGDRIAGCGGFIDISQATKDIYFVGTLTAGGLKEYVEDGRLVIDREGKRKKFLKETEQITYSADFGLESGQNVTFITDRCVMKLSEKGLVVTEVAPGIDIGRDIIDQMEFEPIVAEDVKQMDPRIFKKELVHMKRERTI